MIHASNRFAPSLATKDEFRRACYKSILTLDSEIDEASASPACWWIPWRPAAQQGRCAL
jgi:hypothetical protein